MDKEETIAQAKKLRQEDDLEASQALLLALLAEQPEDPLVLYEVGGSYDVLGAEPEAIPYYKRALANGLEGDDRQECLICLGSSQRYVGQFGDAVKTLEKARQQFPDNHSTAVFLALAYYSDDRIEEGMALLLDVLLKTTSDQHILTYEAALDYYKDNLEEVWEEEE